MIYSLLSQTYLQLSSLIFRCCTIFLIFTGIISSLLTVIRLIELNSTTKHNFQPLWKCIFVLLSARWPFVGCRLQFCRIFCRRSFDCPRWVFYCWRSWFGSWSPPRSFRRRCRSSLWWTMWWRSRILCWGRPARWESNGVYVRIRFVHRCIQPVNTHFIKIWCDAFYRFFP